MSVKKDFTRVREKIKSVLKKPINNAREEIRSMQNTINRSIEILHTVLHEKFQFPLLHLLYISC